MEAGPTRWTGPNPWTWVANQDLVELKLRTYLNLRTYNLFELLKNPENFVKIWQEVSKILANVANFGKNQQKCQQCLTKKMSLENGPHFFAYGFQNGAKECIV